MTSQELLADPVIGLEIRRRACGMSPFVMLAQPTVLPPVGARYPPAPQSKVAQPAQIHNTGPATEARTQGNAAGESERGY